MDYIASICLLVGWYYIGKKKIIGIYLNLIGSILFFVFAWFVLQSYAIAFTNLFIAITIAFSIKKWRKNE